MLIRTARRGLQRGLGIVELLVGLAVGLFVVAGGLMLLSGFIDADRRLLVETRLMQDLRAASDMITRDIRRGGYWQNAHTTVWTSGASLTPRNNYGRVGLTSCPSASFASAASDPTGSVSASCYWIDGDGDSTADDEEKYGFDVSGGVLFAVVGPTRQALTDPRSVNITDLRFDWGATQTISASAFCSKGCPAGNCPAIVVREVEVVLRGTAPGDTTIARELRSNVRVRNDMFTGQCN